MKDSVIRVKLKMKTGRCPGVFLYFAPSNFDFIAFRHFFGFVLHSLVL